MTSLNTFVKIMLINFFCFSAAQSSEQPPAKAIEVCGRLETLKIDSCLGEPCPRGKFIMLFTSTGPVIIVPPKNPELVKKLVRYATDNKQVCLTGTGSQESLIVTSVNLKDQNPAQAPIPQSYVNEQDGAGAQ